VAAGAGRLEEAAGAVCAWVAQSAAGQCTEALKQLRGIVATYRMTNKPLPTRPSHFVPSFVRPLREALESEGARALSAGARAALAAAAADAVNARYEEAAREMVEAVRKTETSLRRLKKKGGGKEGGAGGDGGAAELSDTDKICRQLYLDIKEHGRGLAGCGLDPASLPSFQALWAVVSADGEQLSL